MIKVKEFLRRGAGNDAACFQQDDAGSKQQGVLFAQSPAGAGDHGNPLVEP